MKNLFVPLSTPSAKSKLIAFLFTIILIIIAWIFLATANFIPQPSEVATSWFDLVKHEGLLYELGVSVKTNIEAIVITTVMSLAFAYLAVLPIFRPLVVFFSKARFFGLTGFVILFTLIFGGGHGLKVSLLVFGMSTFFITSMSSVIMEIPRDEFDYARTLRLSHWEMVWDVVIRGKFDQALEIMRQNAAMGWVMLTLVEGLTRSEGGLGALMLNENKHYKLGAVFAIQLTVLFIGIVQDQFLSFIRRIICPYAILTTEER